MFCYSSHLMLPQVYLLYQTINVQQEVNTGAT